MSAGRSTLDRLDPAIRSAVLTALGEGTTIDEIVDLVRSMGGEVSRSAAGRYSKRFAEMAAQQRKLRTFAEAFGREFGEGGQEQRMMTQVMTSVVTRALIPIAEGEDVELEPQDLNYLASAVKHTAGAAKLDVDRETRVREEATKRAREEAARNADTAARAAGASPETLNVIRRGILGLAA